MRHAIRLEVRPAVPRGIRRAVCGQLRLLTAALALSGLAAYGQTQSAPPLAGTPQIDSTTTPQANSTKTPQANSTRTPPAQPAARNSSPSAGADVGHGAGDLGKGAAGNTAKGAGDLVTLHPAGAGEDLGKGAKDAGVGAAKGSGKIAKGTGRGIGHLFHHSHKDDASQPSSGPPSN